MKYNYSIIIPHYNIPLLLKRCLNSIPIRNDLQIIVIDDNSAPQYIPILEQLEKDFPHTSFYYSKNSGGAGNARNIGLKLAQGDYILFADADDFFNYCLDDILSEYIDSSYDIVYFNANAVDTNTYKPAWRNLYLNEMILEYSTYPDKALFKLKYSFGEPWCKMISHKLIEKNNIRFSETIIHNDTKFSYLVGYYSQKIKIDNRAMYCVTDRKGSVSKKVSLDCLLTRTAVFSEANHFFKSHNINIFDERCLRPLISLLIKNDIVHAKQCIQIMNKNGMTNLSILLHCLCFPFYVIARSRIFLKKNLLEYIYA